METTEYAIGELEEATGVPRRTIYFYVQQGVLPPPSGAGLAARYHPAHLLRLQAIPRLRALGWRLDRIRAFFEGASNRQIAAILEGPPPPDDGQPTTPVAARAPRHVTRPSPTQFTRYTLAPGVDLFVERDISPALAEAVAQLLDAAVTILSPAGPTLPPSSDENGAVGGGSRSVTNPDSASERSTEDAH